MIGSKSTGRFFYEKLDITERNANIDDVKWELVEVASLTNLCDMQDDTCSHGKYYTDNNWSITYWCQKHFDQQVRDKVFIEVFDKA